MNHTAHDKPQRRDFATDDAFGEAYARWMMLQPRPTPPPTSQPTPRPVSPSMPAGLPERFSARAEIDRDTWNQHTKARFMRSKMK